MPVTAPPQTELAQALAALERGEAAPVAALFARAPGQRTACLKALLAAPQDEPVAQAFALIWRGPAGELSDHGVNLLRWYLVAEAPQTLPARRACQRDILALLLQKPALFRGGEGTELGLVAARLACERGGRPGLRALGGQVLRSLDLGMAEPTPPMVHAALQALDLTLLHRLLDRWPEGKIEPVLKSALDWAMGLVLEFEGLSPAAEAILERRCQADPKAPLSAQRRVQMGLHRGQGFADLAHHLQDMRRDVADPNLTRVLTFAFWQARLTGDAALAEDFRAELLALEPGWKDGAGARAVAPPGGTAGEDLPGLIAAGQALIDMDWRLDSPWEPDLIAEEFARIAGKIGDAALPPGWGPQRLLETAQALLQQDRRDFAWCAHFDASPHATGLPRYGMTKLRLIPALHRGAMALIAALCHRGLDLFLSSDPEIGLSVAARLLQLHNRAALAMDQPEAVRAVIEQVAVAGLMPDILALERDDLALHLGGGAGPAGSEVPVSRAGSQLHPFLPRAEWTAAEAVHWTALAGDAPITGRFEVLWPEGRLEVADHDTPGGEVLVMRVQGLRLVPEDFVIGPGGAVLRPDPYHTSEEFPWPSPWMVAAGRRAIRLRPQSWTRHESPVLVLEAFEALRWRNYYHWMVPILSRIALAREKGLLDNRRLVLPEGLSGWMRHSLALLGLSDAQLLVVPPGQGQVFDDALLLSSVEHVSASCIGALRRGLMGKGAAAAAVAEEGPLLFLSRRAHGLRTLVNQDEVEAIAAEMGFDVIAPEELGIPGQIALFARARGVAAVEGAALTNTLFCPPGIPVLAILCEDEMMPIFNDLSLVLGHAHRKLPGRASPQPGRGNRLQPPFRVDPARAREALEWVIRTAPSRAGKARP